MKIVFDIPEDEYNYIKNCYPDGEDGERYAYMIKRSGEPLEKVLGEIKAEIDRQYKWLINTRYTIRDVDIAFGSIFRTIDKYKAESEDKE